MEPTREVHATLVDLLDRILDKGLVIHADVIVSVAGIPLIGVNLRAALAGMETMLKYGLLKDWDQRSRSWETEQRKSQVVPLKENEKVILKVFGSFYYSEGIYTAWRPGWLYLTDKRLILWRQEFNELIFQTSLGQIKGLIIRKDILYLIFENKKRVRLRTSEADRLEKAIKETAKSKGFIIDESIDLAGHEEEVVNFLTEGETVTHKGKAWHLVPSDGIWRPGRLYITNKRLCWCYDFEKSLVFSVATEKILGSAIEVRNLNKVLKRKRVFDVIYEEGIERKVVSFSGEGMYEWERALNRIISFRERTEACPQCGKKAIVLELLEKGCPSCDWVSPRLKQRTEDRGQRTEKIVA